MCVMHGADDKLIQSRLEVLKGGSRSDGIERHEMVGNVKINRR
jgi:hypothetical protein